MTIRAQKVASGKGNDEMDTRKIFALANNRKEQPMKPFARINLSSVLSSVALAKGDALRMGILVSSLAQEGRGKAKGEA